MYNVIVQSCVLSNSGSLIAISARDSFLMCLWIKRYESTRSLLCFYEVSLMMYYVLSSLRPVLWFIMSMCSPVYCDTDTPPRNVAATLLDPPYDDDDGSCRKGALLWLLYFEWLKSQKPWMKSKKRKMRLSYCYNTNTNWKFQTHWMLKNRDHWWASIATQFRAERKLFAKKTFSWKEIYLLEIVIKFCRKRTQISFFLLMYICQEVERKVIALWRGNVKVDAGM